jgi:hypothetical protein
MVDTEYCVKHYRTGRASNQADMQRCSLCRQSHTQQQKRNGCPDAKYVLYAERGLVRNGQTGDSTYCSVTLPPPPEKENLIKENL